MPNRRPPPPPPPPAAKSRPSFRARYEDLETRRSALIARLSNLGGNAQAHPSHKRVLKLLNETFRSARLAQRLAVLQSAEWMLQVLEKLTLLG